MNTTIGSKDYTLHFGWDFLETINNLFGYVTDIEGVSIETKMNGYPFMEMGLGAKDPIAVQKVIQAGTSTEKSKPSKVDIRKFIEDKLIDETYSDFVEELHQEIKKDKLLSALAKMNQG